ncbi:hypothetical protein JKF63_02848 [Porcisia hertigi]|uniref:Uncharacterized protein n=1 Tax=Porcisia hertigi TaxID=2761500 RepID=A0A836L649_9TRYP|nr:hypothetical protein JKF63_02848 [Porcisia hertigi]
MCTNPSEALHVPTVYDLTQDQFHNIGTFASQQLEDVYSGSARLSAVRHATSPSSATRSITDFLDDIFFSSTGVHSWSCFLRIQQEGAALRRQLGKGAIFAHEGLHPSLSPFLKDWAQSLRTQQAARARAVGADETTRNTAVVSSAAACGSTPTSKLALEDQLDFSSATPAVAAAKLKCNTTKTGTLMAAGALDDLDSSSLLVERALAAENARAHLPHRENGLLPLWQDLTLTQRCSPLELHSLRAAVRGYFLALLRLIDIMESLSDHWGLLLSKELKGLRRAMAAEKAAHVPADFIFSVFTVLNAPEERLSNALEDLRKCTRLEVVRLNGNIALTELNVLPPHCRVFTACGCRLAHFLEAAHLPPLSPPSAPPPDVYASLTTLGLAYNRLRHLHFVQQLPSLCILDMSFNYLGDLETAVHDVAAHGSLTEVTLQGNPISLLDLYRTVMVRDCVHLDRLDGVAVTGEERALSRPPVDDSAAAQEKPLARSALANSKAGDSGRSSAVTPSGSRGKGASNVGGSSTQPSPSSKSSVRGRTTPKVPQLPMLNPPSDVDASQKPLSDQMLRTTVAVGLDLITVKGVASLQPVPQSCEVDSLLPSSSFLLELAGVDTLTRTARLSVSSASHLLAGSLVFSPLASSGTFTSHIGGGRKSRNQGRTSGDGGKAGSSSNLSPNSKRAVVPLYEVSSRVTVEGCWGGTSVSSSDAAPGCADVVRVAVELNLNPPAPSAAPHEGRHTGVGGATSSNVPSTVSTRQRKAGGSAAATGGGALPPPVPDPYIPARAAAEAQGGVGGVGGAGDYACSLSLPITDTLVQSLQQPLLLRVIVHDTFRFAGGDAALRAQLEVDAPSSSRGSPASRNGPVAPKASEDFSSQLLSPAPHSSEERSLSATARERGGEDTAEEAEVHLQHELGVIALDPSEMFSTAGTNPATCTVVPCSSTPLPSCRVLYVHDAAVEKDPYTLKSAEREVRQRQGRLNEALAAYSHIHQQHQEASRRGMESSETFLSAPSATLGKDTAAFGTATLQSTKRLASVAVVIPPSSSSLLSSPPSRNVSRSRHASLLSLLPNAPQLQSLHARLKAQQLRVAQRAVRVLAMRARLAELNNASLSVSARFSVGRGAPPPLTPADAELDALRRCPEVPVNRKGRQQSAKGTRR